MALVAVLAAATIAAAHPGSGIGVDQKGQVLFVDTGEGVFKVDAQGKLSPQKGPAFHWMTLDPTGRFGRTRLPQGSTFEMTVVGSNPSILSSDFPVTIGRDVAVAGRDLDVLEFLHTASDNRREWIPRVRKLSRDGRVTLVAAVRR